MVLATLQILRLEGLRRTQVIAALTLKPHPTLEGMNAPLAIIVQVVERAASTSQASVVSSPSESIKFLFIHTEEL